MRSIKQIFIVAFGALMLASCVSNKKVQYLQHDDVNAKEVVLDSVVRSYVVENYEYKIQPNDILSIQFESLTQDEFDFLRNQQQATNNQISNANAGAILNGELVDEQGDVEFPVLGKVKVAGRNIYEVQDILQEIANGYLTNAVVKVRLLNFRFTILGEVRKEGTITSYNNRVSIMEGLGLAGGLDDLANRSDVKIVRSTGGVASVVYVDLLDEDLLQSPYYYLHQNDVIIVPPLKQRPFRKYASQNAGLILSSISTILLVINLLKN